MEWKVVRLELACNSEFPRGSAGRSYLIRVPLTDEGTIDPATLEAQPARATVRRYWPNQADMSGYLVRTPLGFAIRYEISGTKSNAGADPKESSDQNLFSFGAGSIKIGDEIYLTELDGHEMRFRVAACNSR